jgi:hypothetical protein
MKFDLITLADSTSAWASLKPSFNQDANPSINVMIVEVIRWASLFGGILAVSFLIYSGFVYLTSAGNADAAKKGSKGILYAIIGTILLSLSYLIFSAIKNQLQ